MRHPAKLSNILDSEVYSELYQTSEMEGCEKCQQLLFVIENGVSCFCLKCFPWSAIVLHWLTFYKKTSSKPCLKIRCPDVLWEKLSQNSKVNIYDGLVFNTRAGCKTSLMWVLYYSQNSSREEHPRVDSVVSHTRKHFNTVSILSLVWYDVSARDSVTIFNIEFHKVGQRRDNA